MRSGARGRGRTLEKKGRERMRASGEEREGLGLCGGIKRGVAREKKKRARGTAVAKGKRGEEGGMEREMRKKAVEEKEKERKRDGVEAASFLSRHRRSHPTKIDSVSLDSSVQRRATPRNLPSSSRARAASTGLFRPRRPLPSYRSLSFFLEEPYSIASVAADVPREEAERARERDCKRVAGDETDRARLDDSYLS